MTPWDRRACYGGFDWWYAMPRRSADVIARFRDEISCTDLDQEEILGGDPYYSKPTECFRALGCEGWLAAWMWRQKLPFDHLHEFPWPAKR
mmetsp:Transcript_50526/g.130174  ORF Transcript_50526/g.130174 Transcript_50526/m.130174 type:complete len:91 (-) Transcript_50526:249-521(-)